MITVKVTPDCGHMLGKLPKSVTAQFLHPLSKSQDKQVQRRLCDALTCTAVKLKDRTVRIGGLHVITEIIQMYGVLNTF